jgi:dipeptidyl aminopeptidase/acylaminoacyl peptidase
MQVTTFIDGHQPPMLLLYGDADRTVKLANLERLEQRIKQKGGRVEKQVYPGVGHRDIAAALTWLNIRGTPVLRDMKTFFQSNVR